MQIKKYVVGYLRTNAYVVYDEDGKEGFLVDPCRGYEKIKDFIEENQIKIKNVLITHGHIDHIEEATKWQEYGAKVCIGKDDAEKLSSAELSLANLVGLGKKFIPFKADKEFEDGEIYEIGVFKIKVLKTAGHTKGGVCYILDEVIFCGDTLFRDSYGRYDFIDGDFRSLKKSIDKLFALPKDYKLYCGHGEDTTLYYEKQGNPILSD